MATMTSPAETCTIKVFHPTAAELLERRIRGEFKEMPALRLSSQQASRLWSVDCEVCAEVLDALVRTGFLRRDRNGMYARSHPGY